MEKRLLILFSTCFFFLHISAQEKYRAVHWGLEEGLSQGEVYLILKDVKGFLWIQTKYGLNRFDGSSFKTYLHDPRNRRTIAGNLIYGLIEDSLHNIWIGTDKGLSRYDIKADTFSNFPSFALPFWATHNKVYCTENSAVVTYDIHSFKKETKAKLDSSDLWGYGVGDLYSIFDSAANTVWLLKADPDRPGTGLFEISLADGSKKSYHWPAVKIKPGVYNTSEAMKFDKKRNCIWINTSYGLLNFSISDKKFHYIDALEKYVNQKDYNRFVGIEIDINGRIWFATVSEGIMIYDPSGNTVSLPFPQDSAMQKDVSDGNACIYYDRDNIIWIGTWLRKGIYAMLPYSPVLKHYWGGQGKKNSLNSNFVVKVDDAGQNKLWITTAGGINILDTKTDSFHVLQKKDLPGIQATGGLMGQFAIDTVRKKAWLSTDLGFFKADMLTKKCTPIILKDLNNNISKCDGIQKVDGDKIFISSWHCIDQHVFGLEKNSDTAYEILSFANAPFNMFYTVPVKNQFLFLQGNIDEKGNQTYENRNGKWVVTRTPIDSIRWTFITYIRENDSYWVAGENKLFHFDDGFHIIKTYSPEDGLPQLQIVGLINDNYGNIWFHTDRSIGQLNVTTGQIKTLSEADGFEKQDFELLPFADKDANGNIYYCGGNLGVGFNKISPANFPSTTSSVYLRSLTINQKPFPLKAGINYTDTLALKYNQTKIDIETGIIDFYSKGKSRIRYKLEGAGINESWQYAPYYYTIRYEGLQPGRYALILQASNASNEFNGPEKRLLIHISPPFWRTWWFRTIAVITLLLLFYGIYRWRTATLRKQKRVLEQTVKERTAEVVQEKAEVEKQKAKSDELLLNILPSEVAEELKEKGYTTAKSFDEVTILFSDIKGFTHVAEKLTAQELVREIDTYFSAFDNIMQQYGLEKIKTIGDAYIAAGGLPEDNKATVQNVVEAAIAMQSAVEDFKKKRVENNLPYFELRIGIHTGPVVAGVVGIKKFQYDIWGDTVNLAARMEQSGVPGKINISQYTYEKVKDQFHCEHRGKIDAKNKGEIDMYFIIS